MQGKTPSQRGERPGRRPPPRSDPRRRGVPEAAILDHLVSGGFAYLLAERRESEARALAAEALDRWVREGLPHETAPGGGRRFDPAEVVNGLKWAGLQGRDPFWQERWIETERRMIRDLAAADPEERAHLHVSFERTFDLTGLARDTELLLRAPLPLAGADHAVLALEPRTSGGASNPLAIRDGSVMARLRPGGAESATLAWTATLGPPERQAAPATLSAEEAELYLRPSEGLVRLTPRVRELAELWAGRLTGWEAATEIRRRLGEAFCMGMVGYEGFEERSGLDWVLDHGWFDCLLGSALLVALCRSRGAPARLVSGRCAYPLQPTVHSWAEVWAEGAGWRAIDLGSWDLSAGDADAEWRDDFTGKIDRRIVHERPPRRVTGPMSVRPPREWRLLPRFRDGWLDIGFAGAASGKAVFTDRMRSVLEPLAVAAGPASG